MNQSSKQRVRAQYDAVAPAYERRWSRYVDASVNATLTHLTVQPGERVLDVGCGTGLLLARLAERAPAGHLAGVDLSPAMIGEARRRLPDHVLLAVADAEDLPFATASFEVVVSSSAFHYWPAPARALAELRRVLCQEGRVVITDWCDDYLACRVGDRLLRLVDPAHRRIYGRAECATLLTDAQYQVTAIERYRISWLWGLMTAAARRPGASPGHSR